MPRSETKRIPPIACARVCGSLQPDPGGAIGMGVRARAIAGTTPAITRVGTAWRPNRLKKLYLSFLADRNELPACRNYINNVRDVGLACLLRPARVNGAKAPHCG